MYKNIQCAYIWCMNNRIHMCMYVTVNFLKPFFYKTTFCCRQTNIIQIMENMRLFTFCRNHFLLLIFISLHFVPFFHLRFYVFIYRYIYSTIFMDFLKFCIELDYIFILTLSKLCLNST